LIQLKNNNDENTYMMQQTWIKPKHRSQN